jgi:hypothetical protein
MKFKIIIAYVFAINMLDISIRILYLYLLLANTTVKNLTVRKMTD